jgi:cell wall-associated NlpC family hydrolase
VPLHTPSTPVAPTTPVRRRPARSYATRAATVATTSAAAALLALLPAGPAAPAAATAAPAATAAVPAAGSSLLAAAAALPAPAAPAPVVTAEVAPVAVSAPAASRAASAVQLALGKLGAPYRWGGAGPSSFDCSGLVSWAYRQAGVELPRTSRAMSRTGTPVARRDLRPGDLVFFYSPVSHVGIYIGDGRMVHASTSGKPVTIASIDGRPFHSARRV